MNFEIWCLQQQDSYRNREGLIFVLEIQIIYIIHSDSDIVPCLDAFQWN